MTETGDEAADKLAYQNALRSLQSAAAAKEALEFIARYDSDANTLILGSYVYDFGNLTDSPDSRKLSELDPDDDDAVIFFMGAFSEIFTDYYFYNPGGRGTIAEVDGKEYDYTLSGTIANVAENVPAPIVDASSDAVLSLTLNGYASTGLVVGDAPLYLNGTNYLTNPGGSPLTASEGELNIYGTITEALEKNYPKDVNDTLTLTTGAGAVTKPVIENGAVESLQINLTNVKAITAYGQSGSSAVGTEYSVTYHDDALSGEEGAYGYAWLQDLSSSSAAAAVTRSAFNGDSTGYNYLKLYASTSDAGASVERLIYDKSDESVNVRIAEIYAPAVLGLVHKFDPDFIPGDGLTAVMLLDSAGKSLGTLTLDADYTWSDVTGTFELLITEGSTIKVLPRGSYTIKLYFHDENPGDADYYTLSIPLTVMETVKSDGDLEISPEDVTTRRGQSVSFKTSYEGPTPKTYVWEIVGATSSGTMFVGEGASVTLVIGDNEQGNNGTIEVKVSSYEGEDTTVDPLGTASATITIAPTAVSMEITCVNETPSGDGSYTLYHNTVSGTAKSWNFNALVTLDDGGKDTNVTWSLWGAALSKTDIASNGVLTIHPSETGVNGLMKLTATYKHGDGSTFSKTINIHLSSDSFVSYDAAGTNGSITNVKYGNAQTVIAESGSWIPKNNVVTATATPAEGYIVKTWYVNGVSVMDNAAYIVNAESHKLQFITSSMTHYKITADYINASSYRVTYSVNGSNGSVSAVSNGEAFDSGSYVTKGDSVTITASPNNYCVVSHWIVDGKMYEEQGVIYTDTKLTLPNIESDRTVSVVFAGRDLDVKAVASQSGGGAPEGELVIYLNGTPVTPQQQTENDNSVSYTTGANAFDSIFIFASPKSGYQVKTWKIMQGTDYVEINGTSEMLTYSSASITADLNVLVVFEPIPEYNLTVYSNSYENGTGTVVYGLKTVEGSKSDVFKVQRHSTATLVAVPDTGSYLYDWTVEDSSGKPYSEYEEDGNVLILKDATKDVIVRARFRTNYFGISLSADGDGTIQADYSNNADHSSGSVYAGVTGEVKGGSTVVLTATPSDREMLSSLKINGSEVTPVLDTSGPTYSFTIDALAEDIDVEAKFVSFDYYNVTAPEDYDPGGTVAITPADDGFSTDLDSGDRAVEIAGGSSAIITFSAEPGYIMNSVTLKRELDKVLDSYKSEAGYSIALSGSDYVVSITGVDMDLDFSSMATPFVEGSQTTFTVNLNPGPNGAITAYYKGLTVLDGAQLPDGAELTVIAIPDEHYKVTSLTASSGDMTPGSAPAELTLPDNAYISTTTLVDDTAFSAQFEVSEYKVTINVLGVGSGTVTVEDSVGRITSTGYMPAGSELVITAAADSGSTLSYLVVGDAEVSGNTETVDSLNGELTISAVFEAVTRVITFNTPKNGTLKVFTASGEVTNGQILPVGTTLAVIAVPDANYKVASLTGGGTAIVGNAYKVDSAKQNAIVCLFELSQVQISWATPTDGTVTVTYGSGSANNGDIIYSGDYVPVGTSIRINVKANDNYELSGLKFNGASISSGTQHIANSNTQIEAIFKYIGVTIPGETIIVPGGTTIIDNETPKSDSVYFLLVSVIGNGLVEVRSGDEVIESGSSIEIGTVLTVTAASVNGTNLLSLKINGVEVKSGVEYEVYANTDIVAEFDITIPYYFNANNERVFLGLAYDVNEDGIWDKEDYIAPAGKEIHFAKNKKTFTDISNHWATEYIDFVANREIFVGVTSTEFSPDTNLSRAMFTAVIGRLYERSYGEIPVSDDHAFIDCDYTAYYGKYVDWAAENGIIKGYGDGFFGPDDPITREQMAAIMYNFVAMLNMLPENSGTSINFRDANEISDWASDAVLFCQTTGLIQGVGDGIFAPAAKATRAEAATITTNFIKYILTRNAG